MKKVLLIDSSLREEVKVSLQIKERTTYLVSKTKTLKAQAVLPLIDRILNKNGLKISDVEAIEVNRGPGSFTGLRVGVSIANALGFGRKIPVNGKRNTIVTPVYEARPR